MLGGHRGRGVRKKAERKATKIVIEKCHHKTQFIINKKRSCLAPASKIHGKHSVGLIKEQVRVCSHKISVSQRGWDRLDVGMQLQEAVGRPKQGS